ncbi:putative NACHT domain-containing protein [Seiridium unicorne]|uniref:NACHT domain-containing protein n=1 Tax=Seiridium unicorne TaxID=138068 RepID=A0ABR2UXQ5_9PEZI
MATSTDTTPGTTANLQSALSEFESILSQDERRTLRGIKEVPDADSAIQFTAQLDRANSKRRGASLGSRLYSMLLSVQEFSRILSTFVSSHPEVAALVWGSVQLTMLIAANFVSYFQELTQVLKDYDKWIPRFNECRLLFPLSTRLQAAICDFHASLIRFCREIVATTKRSWQSQLILSLGTSFQAIAQKHAKVLQEGAKHIQFEINLAKAETDLSEQRLQERERKAASKHRKLILSIAGNAKDEFQELREWRAQIDKVRQAEQRQSLIGALSDFDPMTAFKQARAKRYPSTGDWFTESPGYLTWKDSDTSRVLFLSGKIGAGKTILAANVVDCLLMSRKTTESVFFFFLKFDDNRSLQAEVILRSIIRQWIHPSQVSDEFAKAVEDANKTCYSTQALLRLLCLRLEALSQSYIVIDAVDECDRLERQLLFQVLNSLLRTTSLKMKLLIVGRNIDIGIKASFPDVIHICMDKAPVERDIGTFVRQSLSERYQIGQLSISDEHLVDVISDILTRGAEGMFLWVALEIEEICSQVCEKDILSALQSLPKGLEEVFSRSLGRIQKQKNQQIAGEIFQWVTVATRPLKLEEMEQALSVRVGDNRFVKRVTGVERIPHWCAHLVEIDEITSDVQFIHHSVRHFILDTSFPGLSGSHGNFRQFSNNISELCLTYLDLEDLKMTVTRAGPPRYFKVPEPTLVRNTALSVEWKGIVTSGLAEILGRSPAGNRHVTIPHDTLARFENRPRKESSSMLRSRFALMQYAQENWLIHSSGLTPTSSLYFLWKETVSGSHELAQTPWTQGNFKTHQDFIFIWAQEKSHLALLHLLLSIWPWKAEPIWPLWPAVLMTDNVDFLERYVSLGISSVDQVAEFFRLNPEAFHSPPAQWAESLERLSGKLETARSLLYACVKYSATAPLRYLLRRHSNLVSQISLEALVTFLGNMTQSRSVEIFQILLDYGAQDITDTNRGESLIHMVVRQGSISFLDILLQYTPRLNHQSITGHSPLHLAMKLSTPCIAKRLISSGANVNTKTALGWTPLHEAAVSGSEQLVDLLCTHGATVDATTQHGETPLHFSVAAGARGAVAALTTRGAGISCKNHFGITPLDIADQLDNDSIAKDLRSYQTSTAGVMSYEHETSAYSGPRTSNSTTKHPARVQRKVLILGIAGSGKTTLLNTLLHEQQQPFAHGYKQSYTEMILHNLDRSGLDRHNANSLYFTSNIERIESPGYIPTSEDVLRCSIPTTGSFEASFNSHNADYKVIDIGGSQAERNKWVHYFENVECVLFTFDPAAFSANLEDYTDSRMREQLELIQRLVNTERLRASSFIVVFTKMDLLPDYIPIQPIAAQHYLDNIESDTTVVEVTHYLRCLESRFLELMESDILRKRTRFLRTNLVDWNNSNPAAEIFEMLDAVVMSR